MEDSKLTEKDKKDWEDFLQHPEKYQEHTKQDLIKKTLPKKKLPLPTKPRNYEELAKKYTKFKLIPQDEYDLHGLTLKEAKVNLIEFIQLCFKEKKLCLRIITGKSIFSENKYQTLKGNVPLWLQESPLKKIVADYGYSHKQDGGDGSLLVILIKN